MNVIVADINTADSSNDLLMRLNALAVEAFRKETYFDDMFVASQQLQKGASSHRQKLRGDDSDDGDYTTAGEFIEGGDDYADYVDWSIDRPIRKAYRMDVADLSLTYWEEISNKTMRTRRHIQWKRDAIKFNLLLRAARTAAVSNVHNGGNVVETHAADVATAYPLSTTGATNLIADINELAYTMDNNFVPDNGNRFLYISAYAKQVLLQSPTLFSRDYNGADVARYADRFVGVVAGFKLIAIPDSIMPSTNITTELSKYNVNASVGASSQRQPVALAATVGLDGSKPIGRVTDWDLRTKIWFDENRDVWLVKSDIHDGYGVFAPWCAGEIGVASS